MSEEKKEDNLENAIHEIERFVRLNDRERALTAVEHIKKFSGESQDVEPMTEPLMESYVRRIAEAMEHRNRQGKPVSQLHQAGTNPQGDVGMRDSKSRKK